MKPRDYDYSKHSSHNVAKLEPAATPPHLVVDAVRMELEAIDEYRRVHGGAAVSPTFQRFERPTRELIDLYLVAADRVKKLEDAVRGIDGDLYEALRVARNSPAAVDVFMPWVRNAQKEAKKVLGHA